MSRKLIYAAMSMVLAFGLALGTGCKKGTPTTCSGWTKLLRSPVNGRQAIKEIGELRCGDSIPTLLELFPKSQFKDDILQAVRTINKPEASIELLKVALVDPDSAAQAAVVAEDFAMGELRQPLLDLLKTGVAPKARLNALLALEKIDKDNLKQHESLLIELLRNDPNFQGIQVNAAAARILGEIGSTEAIPHLIVGLFLKTQRGEQMYAAARKALARIGTPAVAPLIAVQANDRQTFGPLLDDLASTTAKLAIYEWQWQDGPEVVQVLGDIRDPAAAMPLAKSLGKPLNPPVGVEDRVTRTWQIAQQNRITMSMLALWNVGTAETIPVLKEIVVNPDNDAKLRLDTASAIGMLPDYVGIPALLDIFAKTKAEVFRAPMVKSIAIGIDWANLSAFERMLSRDKSELVQGRVAGDDAGEFQSLIGVLKTCQEGDVECLIKVLKGDDPIAATKAAILMGNMKGDAARTALKALLAQYPQIDPKKYVDLRRFVIVALWRLGDKSTLKDIDRLIQADTEAKGARYWVDELDTLRAALSRK